MLVPKLVVELEEAFARPLRAVDETGQMIGGVDVTHHLDASLVKFPVEILEKFSTGLEVPIDRLRRGCRTLDFFGNVRQRPEVSPVKARLDHFRLYFFNKREVARIDVLPPMDKHAAELRPRELNLRRS